MGLTAKVLNDCLRLLVSYEVLEKRSFAEVPPRVEYDFTPFGRKFVETFRILDDLEDEIENLSEAAERCRKTLVVAKVAAAVGGILVLIVLLGLLRLHPMALIVGIAAGLGGVAGVVGPALTLRMTTNARLSS